MKFQCWWLYHNILCHRNGKKGWSVYRILLMNGWKYRLSGCTWSQFSPRKTLCSRCQRKGDYFRLLIEIGRKSWNTQSETQRYIVWFLLIFFFVVCSFTDFASRLKFWHFYLLVLTFAMQNKLRSMPTSNLQPVRLLDPGCWYNFTYNVLNDKQCRSRSVGFFGD